MKSRPLISVIVPAFQAAPFLEAALASAAAQSYREIEVWVVDDGSTDDTAALAARWAERDARFQLLRHDQNRGLPTARNTALARARGEFIAFLDADDTWFEPKLEQQMALVEQDPAASLIFTNYWHWDGVRDLSLRYRRPDKLPKADCVRELCHWNQFGISSVLLRRATVERAGGFDPALLAAEDWDLWLRIADGGLRARGLWEPQLRYRVWPGSLTANRARMAEYEIRVLEKTLGRPQPSGRARHLRRSLRRARGNLVLARARRCIGEKPEAVRDALLEAWRCCPRRLKWLMWYCALTWGGRFAAPHVHRRLQERS